MNLNKHISFFNPLTIKSKCVIIGVGAIGSEVARQLVKQGVKHIEIYDFDTVDEHNVTNQIYNQSDIGKLKTEAIKEKLLLENPELIIKTHGKYENQPLDGEVFLMVDSIDLRKAILETNMYNPNINNWYDCRITLTEAQTFFANHHSKEDMDRYISTMNFKDEDVKEEVSPCGTTLSVLPTVVVSASLCLCNFMKRIRGEEPKRRIMMDVFGPGIFAM